MPIAKHGLVPAALVVALSAAAAVDLASAPLVGAEPETFGLAAGQKTLTPATLQPPDTTVPTVNAYTYVDGATDVLIKPVSNAGAAPITITRIESSPDGWLGLVTIRSRLESSITLMPGQTADLAIAMVMSNCEDSGPGGYLGMDNITVDYTELGLPHTQKLAIGPYWFESPETCPRNGPARPA